MAFWSWRKLHTEQIWCDCSRSPRCTDRYLLSDWGSLCGSWCCFEQRSAGCVNTSQWTDGWAGRGFIFQHTHNTPSVLRSHYYVVCLLTEQVHCCIICGIVLCFVHQKQSLYAKQNVSSIQASCFCGTEWERMDLNERMREGTLYEWRRWPQLGGKGRERMNDTITRRSWSVCVCSAAEGSLLGPYKDCSECSAHCFVFFSWLTVSLSSYRLHVPVFISFSLRPYSIRHCHVIDATVLHVSLPVSLRQRGMMNVRCCLSLISINFLFFRGRWSTNEHIPHNAKEPLWYNTYIFEQPYAVVSDRYTQLAVY